MRIIDYRCYLFSEPITYQLVENKTAKSFLLYFGNTLIGEVKMVGEKCIQIGGRQVAERMLNDIAKLI